MKSYHFIGFFLLLAFLRGPSIFAQIETLSTYQSLNSCQYLSSKDHPVQIARILPKRAGLLKNIQFHLGGSQGRCKVHLFGQEGGTNFPFFGKDLIPPIVLSKTQIGDTSITISVSDSILIENDQFYLAFTDFEGDFGVLQDSAYYDTFCTSKDGGNFYPTLLLNRDSSKWLGDNCHLAMDITMVYQPLHDPLFEDITTAVGLPLNLSNRSIAWADVNKDYWIDLLLGTHLFLNKAGTFEKTKLPIPSIPNNHFKKSIFLDMNNDGAWDIILFGTQKSILLLNDGTGKFVSRDLSIPSLASLQAVSIADINQDTYPDLVLAQLWGKYPEPQPNFLLLNNGQLNFINSTKRLYPNHQGNFNFPDGIPCEAQMDSTYLPNLNRNRRSRGTQFIDYDQDGDSDLYITNYFLETDEFYENNGRGKFTPIAAPKPFNQNDTMSNHGTGVAWYDFDNDGDFDVLIPQLAHPNFVSEFDHRGTTLYQNEDGHFKDVSSSSGIQYEETHAGAAFGDVNNDGLVDLITTVYYGCRYVDLYVQGPNHTFQLSTDQSGFSKLTTGNDVCYIDFNKDGNLDVALAQEGKFRLFKNSKANKNWIQLNLISTSKNHFGIGTLVKVYTQDQVYTQEVNSGKGQAMQAPTTLHFGLGDTTTIQKVEVYWDSNLMETFFIGAVNQFYTLLEGQGTYTVNGIKK